MSRDIDGDGVVDQTATSVLNPDGSTVVTLSDFNLNGTLKDEVVVTTSANGLSVTTQRDTVGGGTFNETRTDVTVLNANDSKTETISDFNTSGLLTDRTVTTTSASGLSKTTQWDTTGAGTFNETQTDVTTLNADGSRTMKLLPT